MNGLIAAGEKIVLRDREAEDLVHYMRWMREGEWRDYDAPWDLIEQSEEAVAKRKLTFLSRCENLSDPRDSAIIADHDGKPLGWINCYRRRKRMDDTWFLGICICEDGHLQRGFGTEALRLWIDYLFANSEVHKLALDTWSFNERMIRVAEKLGFDLEGRRREEICWKGQWLDRVEYGLLRREWENGALQGRT